VLANSEYSVVLPPFLHGCSFPLLAQVQGSTYLLSVSLESALPQPPAQRGVNSIPTCGAAFGGHLPLSSVPAEAKSQ